MTRTALNRGDYLMAKAAKELEQLGYKVEKAKKIRWQQQDFFGCWDIIAVFLNDAENKTGEFLKPLRFIQVSSKPLYDRGREYNSKLKNFPSHQIWSKEYWWWNKHREWRITNL